MALQLVELFGYAPHDMSAEALAARRSRTCPFLGRECLKFAGGRPIGACSVRQRRDAQPIICCPIRLYADNWEAIEHIAEVCFGRPVRLIRNLAEAQEGFSNVVAFGKGLAGELRIPSPVDQGSFSVDWVLAHVGEGGSLLGIAAAEVQTIDTTGSYGPLVERLIAGDISATDYPTTWANAGLNWENVNKRILPQLIYKGHSLRREARNRHGLFFVCPKPVYDRIAARLGEELVAYELQPGALTFATYDLGPVADEGQIRRLHFEGMSTTTVDQAAIAFTAPRNLPPANSYEQAVMARISS